MIYLDHQATTPTDPRVVGAMLPFFSSTYGNAASRDHAFGREAKRAVDEARASVAALIGAHDDEVIFTSGATEADNMALLGLVQTPDGSPGHLVTARTEHKAVLDAARELERLGHSVTYLEVDQYGRVDPEDVRRAIRPDTRLVSIMAANNEIGTLAPLGEIGAVCTEAGVLFHSDAVQMAGHLPLDIRAAGVNVASLSAHKMSGPKGIGALYRQRSNPRVEVRPILFGGGHERGLRPGTLNVPAIVGFGEAARLALREMRTEAKLFARWTSAMFEGLQQRLGDVEMNGHPTERLPHCLNVYIPGVESRALIVDLEEVAIATGSACTSASVEPSHVIVALGFGEMRAHQSIRISVGRGNSDAEIESAVGHIASAAASLREFAS